uniref:(northern house mosquito) hypothetical protein n=1 Tax=Culex pipiens TaxID=7175 RepID=A0A8D8JDA1_CULPI
MPQGKTGRNVRDWKTTAGTCPRVDSGTQRVRVPSKHVQGAQSDVPDWQEVYHSVRPRRARTGRVRCHEPKPHPQAQPDLLHGCGPVDADYGLYGTGTGGL